MFYFLFVISTTSNKKKMKDPTINNIENYQIENLDCNPYTLSCNSMHEHHEKTLFLPLTVEIPEYNMYDRNPVNYGNIYLQPHCAQKSTGLLAVCKNLKYSPYQHYCLNMLKIHLRINILLDNKEVWNSINCKRMDEINKLLTVRYHLYSGQIPAILESNSNEFTTLFKNKKYYYRFSNEPEENSEIMHYNRRLKDELTQYARKIGFIGDTINHYKLMYNFFFNELIMEVKNESIFSVINNSKTNLFSNDTDVEFIITAYSYIYLYQKKHQSKFSNMDINKFYKKLKRFYTKKGSSVCDKCKTYLKICTFIKGNSILCFIYCEFHKNEAKIAKLHCSNKNKTGKLIIYNSHIFAKIDYLNNVSHNLKRKLKVENEELRDRIYYKKMSDFIRYLINNKAERTQIFCRLQMVYQRLKMCRLDINAVLQGILEFELQNTKIFNLITDNFQDSYIYLNAENYHFYEESYSTDLSAFIKLLDCVDRLKNIEPCKKKAKLN